MSDLFGERPFEAVVRQVFDSLGRDCDREDLITGVRQVITLAEFQTWSDASFRRAVLNAVKAPVSTHGERAVYESQRRITELRLFPVEAYETKAREMARQSKGNFDAIRELARICLEIHGRTFDAEKIIAEAAS